MNSTPKFRLFLLLIALNIILLNINNLISQTMYDFEVNDINGVPHHLYETLDQNKVVVQAIFYTNCDPCIMAHQELTNILTDLEEIVPMEIWSMNPIDSYDIVSDYQSFFQFPHSFFSNELDVLELLKEMENEFGLILFPTISVICPDRSIQFDIWPYTPGGAPEWREAILNCNTTSNHEHIDASLDQVKLYPNPTNSKFNIFNRIQLKNPSNSYFLQILNSIGMEVATIMDIQLSVDNIIEVDISLAKGVYFVNVSNSSTTYKTQKLIVH